MILGRDGKEDNFFNKYFLHTPKSYTQSTGLSFCLVETASSPPRSVCKYSSCNVQFTILVKVSRTKSLGTGRIVRNRPVKYPRRAGLLHCAQYCFEEPVFGGAWPLVSGEKGRPRRSYDRRGNRRVTLRYQRCYKFFKFFAQYFGFSFCLVLHVDLYVYHSFFTKLETFFYCFFIPSISAVLLINYNCALERFERKNIT